MRPLKELFLELRQLEVKLWLRNGGLRYRAPGGPLPPALRAEVVARKAEIIAFLEGRQGSAEVQTAPIPRTPEDSLPALSFSQQRLWFLEQLQGPSGTFNLFSALLLRGRLHLGHLQAGLNEVVRRHETLRTRFVERDGLPVPVFAARADVGLRVLDARGLSPAERKSLRASSLDEESLKPFDLVQGPPLRVLLVLLEDDLSAVVVTMHHIVSDGWSIALFVKEFTALYQALLEGTAAVLAPLPIRYRDYAHWQRGWYQSNALKEDLAFWERRLAGAPELLDLPTDWQRPPEQRFRGGTASLLLDGELTTALKALALGRSATLFMTLLAAFKVLLSRLSGQCDILVGTPNANRNRTEIEGLIGFFINTLVLRTDLSGNPGFRELLGRLSRNTLAAYARQDVPFEKIVEALGPERDLSRNPLFQVFFNMLNLPSADLVLPNLTIEPLATSELPSKFDLTFYLGEHGDGLFINAVYNATLFCLARMEEMLRQYEHLLVQITARPDSGIDDFSLITDQAKAVIPDGTGELDASWQGPVQHWFVQRARREPSQVAIESGAERWTYGELDACSEHLAMALRQKGIGAEDVVFVYGCREASLVWALLGILKAGAAFSILDPVYPPERLLACLDLGRPRAWLEIETAGQLPAPLEDWLAENPVALRRRIPSAKYEATMDREVSEAAREPGVEPDQLAYLAFTSGSTGQPKAIEGRHGPFSHFFPWLRECFALDENDRYSMLSGLAHDPLQRDIFTPLAMGARLCIPDPGDITPLRLALWLRAAGVTITHLTPAMGQILTETDAALSLPNLRLAFFVGDILTRRDTARLHRLAPGVQIINYYGTTETQRSVAYHRVERGWDKDPSSKFHPRLPKQTISVGRGIPDVQLLIFNRAQGQAGIGELGEIGVRAPHLARGYLGDPELTRARFIANPFTGRADDRIYRTGDLGRYLPKGEVEYAGRLDHQVKVRGFRIELGEIEAKLGLHPGVREAIALAHGHTSAQKRLVAYWVPEPRAVAAGGDILRAYLKAQLPEYMVPAIFMRLEKLPLTPNGKVDRRALPEPGSIVGKARGGEPPQTHVEEMLAGIWSELLEVERIGRNDHFFNLGGHSLLAARVISRVRALFNVDLPPRVIFNAPTLAAMAAEIEKLRRTAAGPGRPPLVPVTRKPRMPLSFAQARLWFIDQLQGPNAAYNMPAAASLAGSLDVRVLQRSIQKLVDRHECLRTHFPSIAGEPFQVIEDGRSIVLPVIDLDGLARKRGRIELERLMEADGRCPFDLASGPVLRVHLVRLGLNDHIFIFNMHHIVSDGWSIGVVVAELGLHYEILSRGRPAALEPPPIQYVDFAVRQTQWLRGEVLQGELDYWKRALAGAPTLLRLPTKAPRPSVQSGLGDREPCQVPQELAERLTRLARAHDATLFMVLFTAFNVLLYRYSGQADILVGSGIANRSEPELEELVGFFADTWVLRTDLSGDPGFGTLLNSLKHRMLEALDHQNISFDQIVDALQIPRDLGHSPLVQAMLILNNAPAHRLELPELRMALIESKRLVAKMDLVLSLGQTPEGLLGSLEYNTDIFSREMVAGFLGHFLNLLNTLADDPDQAISALPLLAGEDAHRSLAGAIEDFEI